ncbi:hypothetical protein F4859DRAFT_478973 [Xylaria cf. heliscus]|nr:hypothetical protein F4859DRAFT_478973 [Xylaria cf. heliscus]
MRRKVGFLFWCFYSICNISYGWLFCLRGFMMCPVSCSLPCPDCTTHVWLRRAWVLVPVSPCRRPPKHHYFSH